MVATTPPPKRYSDMSEHILKIALSELKVMRIKRGDGVIEFPIDSIANHMHPQSFSEETKRQLFLLKEAVAHLRHQEDLCIEFVIPVED